MAWLIHHQKILFIQVRGSYVACLDWSFLRRRMRADREKGASEKWLFTDPAVWGHGCHGALGPQATVYRLKAASS